MIQIYKICNILAKYECIVNIFNAGWYSLSIEECTNPFKTVQVQTGIDYWYDFGTSYLLWF